MKLLALSLASRNTLNPLKMRRSCKVNSPLNLARVTAKESEAHGLDRAVLAAAPAFRRASQVRMDAIAHASILGAVDGDFVAEAVPILEVDAGSGIASFDGSFSFC